MVKELADLALHIDGWARGMHTNDEGLECGFKNMHLEAQPV